MKLWPLILCSLSLGGCEQTFNLTPQSPTVPGSVNVTNTNTNTATNTDKTGSDTGPVSTDTPASGVIPLPAYGESVVRSVASSNSTLLANSCQDKFGESAWAFLDLAVRTLQMQDSRWGYLCKDATCSNIAKDIVAYRASNGNNGIWIVDVIGNHCPGPNDVVTVTWQTLPFETTRPWIGIRR